MWSLERARALTTERPCHWSLLNDRSVSVPNLGISVAYQNCQRLNYSSGLFTLHYSYSIACREHHPLPAAPSPVPMFNLHPALPRQRGCDTITTQMQRWASRAFVTSATPSQSIPSSFFILVISTTHGHDLLLYGVRAEWLPTPQPGPSQLLLPSPLATLEDGVFPRAHALIPSSRAKKNASSAAQNLAFDLLACLLA